MAFTAPAVPDDLDMALTPEWLTCALRPRFPGVEVSTVERGPVVERLSTNARFTIDGQLPPQLPRQLCIKGYFSEVGRTIAFVGEPEAAFYRDLAGSTGIRTLRPVYADVEPRTRHGVVITCDEAAAGGQFLDGNSSFTVDQVADALGELAKLHTATWMATPWATTKWLEPRLGRAVSAWGEPRTLEIMTANLDGANGVGVPAEMRDASALLAAHRRVSAKSADTASGWCVIHGDAHVGNIMVDVDRRPWLVDWQLVQRGLWQVDVGYLIAATLTPEQRRVSEQDLLRHYLDRRAAYGGAAPSFDDAWPLLVDGMVHGFFLWSITTKVAPDVIAVLLSRLGSAVADHSTKGVP
jgi:hypothetical protein